MPRASTRLRRRLAVLTAVTSCACACAVGVGACVIAEPVSDLPRPVQERPSIVRASVVPTTSSVLGTWPERSFVVPVELADPTAAFQWAAFVDFDPALDTGLQLYGDSVFEVGSLSGRTRVLEIPISLPPDLDRCHVVEVVVALQLESFATSRTAHSPKQGGPGGDSVTWFYSPGGNLAGCPVLGIDAGPDASARDAGIP